MKSSGSRDIRYHAIWEPTVHTVIDRHTSKESLTECYRLGVHSSDTVKVHHPGRRWKNHNAQVLVWLYHRRRRYDRKTEPDNTTETSTLIRNIVLGSDNELFILRDSRPPSQFVHEIRPHSGCFLISRTSYRRNTSIFVHQAS